MSSKKITQGLFLGDRIKDLRKGLKLKQIPFAEKLGITGSSNTKQVTISRWETGEKRPSHEYMARMIIFFKININWLLTGDGEMFIKMEAPEGIVAEEIAPYKPISESSRSAFLLNKSLRNISVLLKRYPDLIQLCSDLAELFLFLADKPYERQMFLEVLEGIVGNLHRTRLKAIK